MRVRAASIGLRCETDEFFTLVIPFHFAFVKPNLGWLVGDGLYLVARFVIGDFSFFLRMLFTLGIWSA